MLQLQLNPITMHIHRQSGRRRCCWASKGPGAAARQGLATSCLARLQMWQTRCIWVASWGGSEQALRPSCALEDPRRPLLQPLQAPNARQMMVGLLLPVPVHAPGSLILLKNSECQLLPFMLVRCPSPCYVAVFCPLDNSQNPQVMAKKLNFAFSACHAAR